MSGARPGWYPDPGADQAMVDGGENDAVPSGARPRQYRWWDGSAWTDAVSDSAQAAEPTRFQAVRHAAVSWPTRSPAARTRAAWTLGVVLVAAAGLVLGLVIWRDPGSAGSGAAAATPRPSATGVTGELDQQTRIARIGDARMTLPAEPYKLRGDPMRVKKLFDSYFAAGAIVHEDYRDGRDWSAVVGLAHVAPEATHPELEQTTSAVAQGIAATFFDGQSTRIGRASMAEHSVDGCSGYAFSAPVDYRIKGLRSRADELTVVVVRLDDGTRVAAFSSVPTDAPAALRAQAAASLASLAVA